jgi:hypothetical protein
MRLSFCSLGRPRRIGAALIVMFVSAALHAQVDTASIVGTVKDATGAIIQSAQVTVQNVATGESQTVKVGNAGNYVFPYLRVGNYTLTAEAAGFKKVIRDGIALDVQDRKQVDFAMEVGSNTQQVTVTDSAPLLETQNADVGTVVDSQQATDLPLNGRRYDQLSLLTAGVNPSSASFQGRAEGVFSVNGNSSTENNYVLDGADNNSYTTNLQDQSAQSAQPAVDSLAEFKLQTRDYDVEYGRSAGGVINASIKSGTNEVHGDVYEFIRNDKLDANDYFLNQAGQPRPAYRQNQYGATLGGPIRKNKVFIFGNYEGTRIAAGQSLVGTVPTPLMRQYNFNELSPPPTNPTYPGAPANCIVAGVVSPSCVDPVGAKIFALYPLPNTNLAQNGQLGAFSGNNYISSPTESRNSDQFGTRVDYKISDKDSVYGHYVVFDLRQNIPGIFSLVNPIADGTAGSTQGINDDRGTNVTMAWVHLFNPTLISDAHYTFNRAASHSKQATFGVEANSQVGLTGIPVYAGVSGGLPELDISGFSQLGSPRWLPQNQFAQIWQFKDTITLIKGTHSLKAGIEWRRDADNFSDLCCTRGFFNFSGQYTGNQGITDLLLGIPNSSELENLNIAHIYRNGFNWFVADSWRAKPKLTINYGVRYEYESPLFERDNRVTNFIPTLNGGQGGLFTVPSNASGTYNRTTVHPKLDNFAPRVGIAYQIAPNLVMRTGAGIYFQNTYRYGSESQSALNPPFLTDHALNNSLNAAPGLFLQNGFPAGFTDPVSIDDIAAVSQLQIRSINSNIIPSDIYEGSFGFQYSVSRDLAVEANYVFNQGRHLWSLTNENQGNLIDPGSPPVIPFPQFVQGTNPTFVEWLDSDLSSSYNGLQISVDKRMANNFAFHVAYTWSKALSQGSDFEAGLRGIQDRYNLNKEWGLWDNDTPQRFVLSTTYGLPVGKGHDLNPSGFVGKVVDDWQLNGIVNYSDGQPITISPSNNLTGAGGGIRANCIATPHINQTIAHWLDPNAYSAPLPYYFGTCGPTPGPRNPGISTWDTSVFKNLPISETKFFQFRAEAFNLWNKPQFGVPNSTVGTPSFGQISSLATNPRQVQFALKFIF